MRYTVHAAGPDGGLRRRRIRPEVAGRLIAQLRLTHPDWLITCQPTARQAR